MTPSEKDFLMTAIILLASAVVIPWCIWVTVSIFKSKMEMALMRKELELLVVIGKTLERIDKHMERAAV